VDAVEHMVCYREKSLMRHSSSRDNPFVIPSKAGSHVIIVKTVVAVWNRYRADGTMERYDTLLKRVRV
jgi:hypothetical protein